MKFMGSKRAMLRNGLGEILLKEAAGHERFVDLFSGSGAVATFVATNVGVPVFTSDLQRFGQVLAASVVERTDQLDANAIWKKWRARAIRKLDLGLSLWVSPPKLTRAAVGLARASCARAKQPLARAYGGHYFSPQQAAWIDALRATAPDESALDHAVCLAALIDAASECAAAPGHTAQPFQPTRSAVLHIQAAWQRDVCQRTRIALRRLCKLSAKRVGKAFVADAVDVAKLCRKGDLVFLDPPYSALHYSRFYHVLESVGVGDVGDVTGVGRYPEQKFRPRSSFSVKSEAISALTQLLNVLHERQASVLITFPNRLCSNGLSASEICSIGEKLFSVSQVAIKSDLSTLGGSGEDCAASEIRGARRPTEELVLLLKN